jgi:hypothetical protein
VFRFNVDIRSQYKKEEKYRHGIDRGLINSAPLLHFGVILTEHKCTKSNEEVDVFHTLESTERIKPKWFSEVMKCDHRFDSSVNQCVDDFVIVFDCGVVIDPSKFVSEFLYSVEKVPDVSLFNFFLCSSMKRMLKV